MRNDVGVVERELGKWAQAADVEAVKLWRRFEIGIAICFDNRAILHQLTKEKAVGFILFKLGEKLIDQADMQEGRLDAIGASPGRVEICQNVHKIIWRNESDVITTRILRSVAIDSGANLANAVKKIRICDGIRRVDLS
jgi:hypothetical protein